MSSDLRRAPLSMQLCYGLGDIGVALASSAIGSYLMFFYTDLAGLGIVENAYDETAKIAAVVEAIRTHQPQENPTSLEGVILRDADILEQLGATSILRTVSKIGRDTRFQIFPDALRVLQKNVDTLPGQLRLPKSRQLAEPRVAALRSFLEAAQREHCETVG